MKTLRFLFIGVLIVALWFLPVFNPIIPALAQTNCTASAPPAGGYTVTVCITSPADGAILTGDTSTTATVTFSGTSPGVRKVVFYMDAAYLLTDYQSPYTFTLPTTKWVDGVHTIAAEAWLRDSFISQRANIVVTFTNGVLTPPVNTRQFQPSMGIVPQNGAPFVVAVGGDGASGETNAVAVANLIQSLSPNLFLYLGDVYEKGSTTEFYNWYGTSSTNFGRFWSITNPTIGNHEYENGIAPGYFNYWDNIPDYYSYNAGGWHFVSLNSNSAYVGVSTGSPQYQWLAQDLAAHSQECTIVYYHHPLFNIGPEGSKVSMTDIWQLMAQNGVSVVLNGHDHDYQRWLPLDGNGQVSAAGITEFVAGAAGHGTQTIASTDSRVAYAIDTNPTAFGVLLLKLNSTGLSFTYQNTTGTILDSGVVPCAKAGADTQPPSAPGNFQATAVSATQANLIWTASSDSTGVSGYTIYRDGVTIATVGASTLTYNDPSLLPNVAYSYSVDAFDLAGNHSDAAGPISVVTPSMPSTLTFVTGADTYVNSGSPTSNYGAAISLRMDASPDLHGYLRFTVQGLAGTPIVSAQLKVYSNSTSSLGIKAVSVSDNSWGEMTMNYNNAPQLESILASSGPITAGTRAGLDVTPYITGEGTYTFGITTDSTTALSLQSRESGGNPALLVLNLQNQTADTTLPTTPTNLTASVGINPLAVQLAWTAASDNVGVTGYTVYRDGVSIATLSGSALNYTDSAVSPLTTYSYTLDAFDAMGNHSVQSASVQVTTPDILAPSVPSNLTAAVGSNQVDLSWAASTDDVGLAGYTLYRDGAAYATLGAAETTFTDFFVQNGLTYSYTVDAFDAAGNHSAQSAAAVATLPDTQPPSTPGAFTATAANSMQVNISWSASTDNVGVAGYSLYRDGVLITMVSAADLSYADLTVQPATTYSYVMDAFDAAGNHSAVTNPVNVTTPVQSSTLVFAPTADSYVSAAKPNVNYGSSTTLRVDSSPTLNSYIRFNVQNLTGRTILRARVLIYVNNNVKTGLNLLSVADTAWGEKQITFANAPAMGTVLGNSGVVKSGTWVTFDVTTAVTGEGAYSFGVTNADATTVGFPSREAAANAPQLILDVQ